MKMTTVKVKVGTHRINAIWTKEMADDVKNMKGFDWDGEARMIEEFVREQNIEKRNKKIDQLLSE